MELTPEGALIRAMDGAFIPIEWKHKEPRAFWKEPTERLLEQRLLAPARRRITFAAQGELSYADWAHALEIAVHEGHDEIDLTPVSRLEARSAEIGFELLARRGSVCLAGLDAPPGDSVEDSADPPDESDEAHDVGRGNAADGEQRRKR